MNFQDISGVAIGRNEGTRLNACLNSILPSVRHVVYVDSGSTDGSVEVARKVGAIVVSLDMSLPFTAARGRNAGFHALKEIGSPTTYIQFIDGDCTLNITWLEKARAFLDQHPDVAGVCGRRREQYPEKSFFNHLCDLEWNTPVGEALTFGGDVLVRRDAFVDAGGYRDDLICGEEPELCIRLRDKGWRIWRLDAEMTLHDANMRRLSQWWRRSVRGGYGFARVADLHRNSSNGIWKREVLRAIAYAGVVPVVTLGAALLHPVFLLAFLAYPLQMIRIALRKGPSDAAAWLYGVFTVLSKFPEFQGILKYARDRATGRTSPLIEYKGYSS